MVAGLLPPAIVLVDPGISQPVRRHGRQQQVIDAESVVALPRARLVVPEGPGRPVRLHRPNGVALSPDERTLYVTQSEPTKAIIMAYSLDAGGNVTGKKLFHDATDLVGEKSPGLPDGLAVASDGTIFTSAPGGILVLSKEGKRLGRIDDGKATANCKFGDDGKTLYLTSHTMLARIRLNITGAGF